MRIMPVYLFALGHQPLLSAAEILAVLAKQNHTLTHKLVGDFLVIESKGNLDCPALAKQLGGTVKIMEKIAASPTAPSIAEFLHQTNPTG